jgi:uncharacterized membrane protein HdeD (DUF308 family)
MPTSPLQNWWLFLLRGLLAVAFGVISFLAPGLTLVVLVYLYAGYMLADGIFALAAALRAVERHERWGSLIFEGLIDLAAAAAVVMWPGLSELLLVYFVAIWAILTGILVLIAASRMHQVHGEWLLWLNGALSLVLGILFLVIPLVGIVAIAWWLGAYAILFGGAMIALGLRLRTLHRSVLN